MLNPRTSSLVALFVAVLAAGSFGVGWARTSAQEESLSELRALVEDELAKEGEVEVPVTEHLDESIAELRERIARLEARRRSEGSVGGDRRAVVDAEAPEGSEDGGPADAEQADSEVGMGEAEELAALLGELLGPDGQPVGSPEDVERFWELLRSEGVVDEHIANLEAMVEAYPGDAELRMQLASAYIAKLFTVPGGPEQGRWGHKAEQQWKETLALEPDHWKAHQTLGINYAYYPDVMNKTGTAIESLEHAKSVQAGLPAAPEHVSTYVYLSSLYKRQGNIDQARNTLLEGLALHPGNAELQAALDQLP